MPCHAWSSVLSAPAQVECECLVTRDTTFFRRGRCRSSRSDLCDDRRVAKGPPDLRAARGPCGPVIKDYWLPWSASVAFVVVPLDVLFGFGFALVTVTGSHRVGRRSQGSRPTRVPQPQARFPGSSPHLGKFLSGVEETLYRKISYYWYGQG